MKNKEIHILLLTTLFIGSLLMFTYQVTGQGLEWEILKEFYNLEINKDGSVNLYLYLKFHLLRGQIQKYVSIPLPNKYFSNVQVSTNDSRNWINYYREEKNNWNGLTVYVARTLNSGEEFTIEVTAKINKIIYSDETNKGNVGVMFIPAWWESPPAEIKKLRIRIVLPEGVKIEDVKTTQNYWMNSGLTKDGRTWVYWEKQNLPPTTKYIVGVSFPKQYVQTGKEKPFSVTENPSPTEPLNFFFNLFPFLLFTGFIFYTLIRRPIIRNEYKDPEFEIEFMGPRKDLDPVEAAVLLKTHPGKIISMILFSLAMKGAIKILSYTPLKIGKEEPLLKLKRYESMVLKCIINNVLEEKCLINTLRYIRKRVDYKVRYFCRKETEEYYQKLVEKKWNRIKHTKLASEAFKQYQRQLLWLFIDKDFKKKTEEEMQRKKQTEPIPVPEIYIYYFPVPTYTSPTKEIPSTTQKPGIKTPTATLPTSTSQPVPVITSIEKFANQVASAIEQTSNQVIKNIEEAAKVLTTPHEQTQQTSHVSSRSCVCACVSCACACACVSCACACAGGGAG